MHGKSPDAQMSNVLAPLVHHVRLIDQSEGTVDAALDMNPTWHYALSRTYLVILTPRQQRIR